MRKLLPVFVSLFFLLPGGVHATNPPANDSIQHAVNIGLLPAPGVCPNNPEGDSVSFSGTTQSATYFPGDFTPMHCFASPSPDVWYRFRASGSYTFVHITGSSGLNNFFAKLYYSQGSSVSLVPLRCETSVANTIVVAFATPTLFGEYYLQIGGNTQSEEGDFDVTMKCYEDCPSCVKHAATTFMPAPTYGSYNIGDSVTMCVTVDRWNVASDAYLHAIVPEFGPDWDTTTLVPVTLPARQSNAGAWIWTISPTPDGPHHGFFFDRNSNGNPADNTGDQGNVMSSWTGCWRIRTKPQCTTNDLSVNINLYSDDQTGTGVPGFICSPYDVLHSECASSCCHGLYVNISQPTNCASNNASVVAAGYQVTGTDTFNYYLVNQYHDTIQSYPSITGAVTFANLSAGQYIVSAVNLSNGNCEAFQTLTIHPAMQASVMQTAMGCDSTSSGTAYAVVSGGLSPYTYNWLNVPAANQNDSVAIGLPDGWIHVQISDAAGCIVTDSVFIQSIPAADPSFSYNHVPYCSNTDTIHVTTLPASPGGVFNLVSPLTAGITVDTGNGDIFLHNTTFATPFWVYVSYSVSNGCSASYTDSVQVIAVPSPPVASTPSTISYCVGSSLPVLGINPNANYIPFWVNVQDNSTALGYSYTPPAGSITAPGQYYYTAFYYSSLSGGCASLPTLFLINAALPPVIQVSGDTTICANEVAFMNASGCSSCTYNWSPAPTGSSSTSPSASTSPSSSTTYTVTATDASGCADMQTVNVVIDQSGACGGGSSAVSGEIHPWGGITPNGDGNNDTWVIDGIDAFPDAIVIIYNRWGMEVWRKSGYDNTNVYWSGEAKDNSRLPDGTYYYIIQLDDSSLHGWVELSR